MGKKSDKKKIRTIEIQIHKGDFKNLRDIAEMIGYDSVEEYIEDAIVRVATADPYARQGLFAFLRHAGGRVRRSRRRRG